LNRSPGRWFTSYSAATTAVALALASDPVNVPVRDTCKTGGAFAHNSSLMSEAISPARSYRSLVESLVYVFSHAV
jgi:hypothetical protein